MNDLVHGVLIMWEDILILTNVAVVANLRLVYLTNYKFIFQFFFCPVLVLNLYSRFGQLISVSRRSKGQLKNIY